MDIGESAADYPVRIEAGVLGQGVFRLGATIKARNFVTITARYEGGVFKPLEDVNIKDGTVVEVHVPPAADHTRTESRRVGDFAFFGMWGDRNDIGDSVDYINNLRRDLRGPVGR